MTATTASAVHLDAARRHDAVLLFDVTDGNPNGDPDAGNLPRVDPETMQGLVSDVAIKRKIRNWVDAARGHDKQYPRYKIFIQSERALNTLIDRAYTEQEMTPKKKPVTAEVDRAQKWMCENFFDVRTFGAVMSTGANAGQVRGPVQVTFARSIDPVIPLDLSITRIAITKPEDMQTVSAEGEEEGGKRTEMGRKSLVPYGLYRAHLFVSPHLAQRTGFNDEDLGLIWQALDQMWDLDHSAARGLMSCRGLYVFSHDNPLGNASAHRLFDRLTVEKKPEVKAPRKFAEYDVRIDELDLPAGVTLTRLV